MRGRKKGKKNATIQEKITNLKKIVVDNGGILLDIQENKIFAKSEISIQCSENHIWNTTYSSVMYNDNWCIICRKAEARQKIIDKNKERAIDIENVKFILCEHCDPPTLKPVECFKLKVVKENGEIISEFYGKRCLDCDEKLREPKRLASKVYHDTHKEEDKISSKEYRSRPEIKERDKVHKKQYYETTEKYRSTKPSRRFSRAKGSAKNRELEFTLTFEQYEALIALPCFYCNGELGISRTGIGLDRLDNSKGYTIDNVVSCCGDCNRTRGDRFTPEETKIMIETILHFRKNGSKNGK